MLPGVDREGAQYRPLGLSQLTVPSCCRNLTTFRQREASCLCLQQKLHRGRGASVRLWREWDSDRQKSLDQHSRLGKYHEYVSGKVSRKRREFGLELRSPQHRGVVRIKLQMRCLVSGSPDCCAKGFQSQNLRAGRGRQSYRVHQHCEGDWDCRPQFPSSGGVPAGV